ncbi:MAG: MerR family DNA-binding protein [Hyphomicrobiaceae bacterium]|nr:MAG: MerR family DNA-binding protein [Hyphomicrobiaceae bacterium]
MSKALTIGTLARRMGVQTSAVRFYERQGLIASERLANGYRVYGEDAAQALAFICRAKALGFSLDQIAEILEIRRAGSAPCGCVKDIIERNLADVERKLAELSRLRRELKAIAARPAPSAPVVKVCPMIEAAR